MKSISRAIKMGRPVNEPPTGGAAAFVWPLPTWSKSDLLDIHVLPSASLFSLVRGSLENFAPQTLTTLSGEARPAEVTTAT